MWPEICTRADLPPSVMSDLIARVLSVCSIKSLQISPWLYNSNASIKGTGHWLYKHLEGGRPAAGLCWPHWMCVCRTERFLDSGRPSSSTVSTVAFCRAPSQEPPARFRSKTVLIPRCYVCDVSFVSILRNNTLRNTGKKNLLLTTPSVQSVIDKTRWRYRQMNSVV
jgi:hypothetical protein